jgi:hypothetical protein
VRHAWRRTGARWLAFALGAALVSASVDARSASTAPGTGTTGQAYVLVAIAANDREAPRLVEALDELTARLGLGVRATRGDVPPWEAAGAPLDPAEKARVWIDARAPDSVSVDVCALHAGTAFPCVHRLLPRSGSSAVVIEEVAHVVYAALESELMAEPPVPPPASVPAPPSVSLIPPLQPSPAETPAPSRATDRPRRATLALDAGAFIDSRMLARSTRLDLGGGAAFVVSSPSFLRPSLWISGDIQSPFSATGPGLDLTTTVYSFRAIPAVEVLRYPFIQVDLGAGGGADVFHDTPYDPRLPYVGPAPAPSTHVSAVFTGQLLARVRLGPSARLIAGLDIDWSPDQHRYEVLGPSGTPTVVLQPWNVRPGALLGLCIPLAGPGACDGGK